MGWETINHECSTPGFQNSKGVPPSVRTGSTWRCPYRGCGRLWELTEIRVTGFFEWTETNG